MRRVITAMLVMVLAVLVYDFFQLFIYHGELRRTFSALENKLSQFKKDNSELRADLEYFSEPENLVKELRSRFNYKKPGEKMIIVVPPKTEKSP